MEMEIDPIGDGISHYINIGHLFIWLIINYLNSQLYICICRDSRVKRIMGMWDKLLYIYNFKSKIIFGYVHGR